MILQASRCGPLVGIVAHLLTTTSHICEIASSRSNPGDYSSGFPFVSGNCVVITAASKYPAAHK